MQFPDIIFSYQLDQALGWTVFHSLWQTTLIAFVTGIILALLRHKAAKTRYRVASLGMSAMLLAASVTFAMYLFDGATPVEQPTTQSVVATVDNDKIQAIVAPATMPVPVQPTEAKPNQGFAQRFSKINDLATQNLPLIVLIWFAGMLLFLLKLLGGLLQVFDLKRRMNFSADAYWADLLQKLTEKVGVKTQIELLESALVRSPITIGHLKPVILFPIGIINLLSEKEVEAILAHELAHIMRKDYIVNILQHLVEAVFYFHPAMWWLSSQVRQERENACDDVAIELTGDKVNYAKALVAVKEMEMYVQTPALAFSGTRKKELLGRVHRLLAQPKKSVNLLEKGVTTVLIATLVFGLAFGQAAPNLTGSNPTNGPKNLKEHNKGNWEGKLFYDSLYVQASCTYGDGRHSMSEMFTKADYERFDFGDEHVALTIVRPAGHIIFEGNTDGQKVSGTYEFVPDVEFKRNLLRNGVIGADDLTLILCYFANFSKDYLSKMKEMGYNNITKEQLQQLAALKLDEKAVGLYLNMAATLGEKGLTHDELIFAKVSNATPKFLQGLSNLGYQNLKQGAKPISFNQVCQLAMHDASIEFIQSMNQIGFGQLSFDQLLSAKIHQMDAQSMKSLMKATGSKPSFNEAIEQAPAVNLEKEKQVAVAIDNLDVEISEAIEHDLTRISFEQMQAMKLFGVDEQALKDAQNLGLGALSAEQVIALKGQGITPGFINEVHAWGFGNLGFNEIMTIKIHGISAQFIEQTRLWGFGKFNYDQLVAAKVHGINTDRVTQCQNMGLGKLTFDQVLQMSVLSITSQEVQMYKKLEINDLSPEHLVAAKNAGVTPDYVINQRKKRNVSNRIMDYVALANGTIQSF
jgi:beta-lactamase regulating signal transducer with metallopeptidase domain